MTSLSGRRADGPRPIDDGPIPIGNHAAHRVCRSAARQGALVVCISRWSSAGVRSAISPARSFLLAAPRALPALAHELGAALADRAKALVDDLGHHAELLTPSVRRLGPEIGPRLGTNDRTERRPAPAGLALPTRKRAPTRQS